MNLLEDYIEKINSSFVAVVLINAGFFDAEFHTESAVPYISYPANDRNNCFVFKEIQSFGKSYIECCIKLMDDITKYLNSEKYDFKKSILVWRSYPEIKQHENHFYGYTRLKVLHKNSKRGRHV